MISVITPAYNAEKYLEQSMMSILNQTYKDIELIVINDCSTDNTEKIAMEIAKKDERVKVIKTSVNSGVGGARCEGLKIAKGDYIFLADADDYYALDFIETLYNASIKYDADIVSGGITTIKYDGSYIAEGEPEGVYEDNFAKFQNQWGDGKVTWTCNKLIKKWLYEKVPYKNRRFIEDTPVILPQIFYANKVVVVNHTGFYHRLVKTSICHTTNDLDNTLYRTLCWCELVEFFMKEFPEFIKQSNILQSVTRNIEWINNLVYTDEEIAPYKDLYFETMSKFFRIIKITGIDFKLKS